MNPSEVGPALKELRESAGIPQQEVADRAGLSPAYLSQIENGRRPVSARSAWRLAQAIAPMLEHAGPLADAAGRIHDALTAVDRTRSGSTPLAPRAVVGLLEPGVTREVAPDAVGVDEGDELWVDATAPTTPVTVGSDRPRIRRDDRGEVAVALGGLHLRDLPPRGPDHFLPAVEVWALPGDVPPYDEYLLTRIEARLGGALHVLPGDGTAGTFPSGVTTVHVVTAANPWPRVLDQSENAARLLDLRDRVAEEVGDVEGVRWGPAITAALDGGLAEEGVAIADQPRATALLLAEEFEQSSIFEWTRDEIRVVMRDGRAMSAPLRP